MGIGRASAWRWLVGILWLGILSSPADEPQSTNQKLVARLFVPKGKVFVGQAVEAKLTTNPHLAPATIRLPRTEDFSFAIREDENEATLLTIVPRRSGMLRIPAIEMERGDHSGATVPISLQVVSTPTLGKTSEYLGGVGRLEVGSVASAASMRLGDTFELRVELAGPGSWGSIIAPKVSIPDARVRELGMEFEEKSATRIFRFAIRPSQPGELKVPAIRVSSFDPSSGRYLTVASRAHSVRVAAISEVVEVRTAEEDVPRTITWLPFAMGVMSMIGIGIITFLIVRLISSRTASPKRFAERMARRLLALRDQREMGLEAIRSLTEFFARYGSRPPAVLTPDEADAWAVRLSDEPDLGKRARRYVDQCDRWLYDDKSSSSIPEDGRAVMSAFLVDLGRRVADKNRERHPGP